MPSVTDATTSVPAPTATRWYGSVVAAVRADLKNLPAAKSQPALSQLALRMAELLDDPTANAQKPDAATELLDLYAKLDPWVDCAKCGESFRRRQGNQVYCSQKCRDTAKTPGRQPDTPCAGGCGKLLWGGRTSLPPGERMCRGCRAKVPPRACEAPGCDQPHHSSGYCKRHYMEHYFQTESGSAAQRRAKAKRRAVERGATATPLDPLQIFERDSWKCGICRRKVSKTLKHPHPRSASLDHIVPIAAGGQHEPLNVQCAHLVCNLRKQHTGAGQLLLDVG